MAESRTPRKSARSGRGSNTAGAGRLFELLEERARREGLLVSRLAPDRLGVGYPYYSELKGGKKPLVGAYSFLRRCADYLEMPFVDVLLLGGALALDDFGSGATLAEQADLVFFKLARDSRLRAIAPSLAEWANLPLSVKLTVSVLYEAYFLRGVVGAKAASDRKALQALLRPVVQPVAAKRAGGPRRVA
jgi:hypothetical protein